MKKFLALASVSLAEEVPGLNGWRVTCRVPIEKPGFALIDDGALYQEGGEFSGFVFSCERCQYSISVLGILWSWLYRFNIPNPRLQWYTTRVHSKFRPT